MCVWGVNLLMVQDPNQNRTKPIISILIDLTAPNWPACFRNRTKTKLQCAYDHGWDGRCRRLLSSGHQSLMPVKRLSTDLRPLPQLKRLAPQPPPPSASTPPMSTTRDSSYEEDQATSYTACLPVGCLRWARLGRSLFDALGWRWRTTVGSSSNGWKILVIWFCNK